MKQLNWKHFVLFLLAIPIVNYVASNLGESVGRRDSNSRLSNNVNPPSDAPIQTVVSVQDSEGITGENLNLTFLKNLEAYTLKRFKVKVNESLQAQGIPQSDIEVVSEAVYVEAGAKKLAIIRLHIREYTSSHGSWNNG